MISGAVYNVLDYGAVADWNGSSGTDNSASINLAYNAAKTAGKGTVLIPKGSYYCSTLVGSNPNDGNDRANNVAIVGEQGTNLIFSGTYAGGTCVGLVGNNVAIRSLNITSTRAINYLAPLDPQRTPYQIGIYTGGQEGIAVPVYDYVQGVEVTNCVVTNMNLPINLNKAGRVYCKDNFVDQFTDTGIIVNDCTTDIWILNNKVTRGGDDCFFARVNPGSAYSASGAFCGRIFVQGNMFHDTFGKNAGFGGFGSIDFSNNYCSLNWAGGVNLENTWSDMLNPFNYSDVLIDNNIFINAGQNWNTGMLNPVRHVPVPGDQSSAIHTVYANNIGETFLYKNITISNNKIVNPYQSCIALQAVTDVFVTGNTFTAGDTDHGSGPVGTLGSTNIIYTAERINVFGNAVVPSLGTNFNYCYSVATATGPLSNIKIHDNTDKFTTGAIAFSDAGAVTATQFNSYDYASGSSIFSLKSYTYANLPLGNQTAYTGSLAYCSNGRKVGEGAGAGTGVPVYYANAAWRVFSTDVAVAI
jgi:hypothetical protein